MGLEVEADDSVKDIRNAIKEVMMKAHKSGELAKSEQYDFDSNGFKPVNSLKMTFDSQQAQLEPIYYWLLDFVQDAGWSMEKTIDNFMSSPGGGHFSEMGGKATRMQEEGMKILGGLNQVVKSALNLVYDLKEFEMRLEHYDDAKSENKQKKENGMLALKQIWLDNVDLKRGRGSIHQMAAELGFTTIREAFMMSDSIEELKKLNDDDEGGIINDQVMRILQPRIDEFLKWVRYSESELRKRMKIEKSYLKSQVETIKMYSQWMKPYLEAAEKLRQKGFDKSAALVNAFSTSMFQLQLFGTKKFKIDDLSLPDRDRFEKYESRRNYNQVIVIGFVYRGHVSQRVTQKGDYGFAMGGRIDMTFDAYALNDDELALAKNNMEEEDVLKSMEFSGDVAAESLAVLKEDLDYFLKSDEEKEKDEEERKKKEGEKKEAQNIDPFSALFGVFFRKKDKKKKGKDKVIEKPEDIDKDNFVEKMMRANAASSASGWLYTVYDIYKKAHGMASAPGEGFDGADMGVLEGEKEGGGVGFKDIFKGTPKG